MNLYKTILAKSKDIDWKNKKIKKDLSFNFPVAKSHPRYKKMKKYKLDFSDFKKFKFKKSDLILIDKFLMKDIQIDKSKFPFVEEINSSEGETKTLNFAERLQIKYFEKKIKRVVTVGGGVMLDFGSYMAEKLKCELVLVPTTIIAMCDASTGGKVRMNFIDSGRYIKHYYKSFYEPDKIIIDFNFLKTLAPKQISVGLAESIKHAFAQSPKFVQYLNSKDFDPFKDFENLKTAIVWTINLKKICLTVDPEETTNGSHKVIYLGHVYGNKLEEESLFKISHGEAVEKGMMEEFKDDPKKLETLKSIYSKLNIK